MNIVLITQARTGSSRLPGKVLLELGNETILQVHIHRLLRSHLISRMVVATTTAAADDAIAAHVQDMDVALYRGAETDVLDRYYQAAKAQAADIVVRVTSDCPLNDPALLDEMLTSFLEADLDYLSNTFAYSYPDGIDIEIFRFSALAYAWEHAVLQSDREHVTPFIKKHSDVSGGSLFRARSYKYTADYSTVCRLTIDETADYNMMQQLVAQLGTDRPWIDYVTFLMQHPDLAAVNSHIGINEGYIKSLNEDGTHN